MKIPTYIMEEHNEAFYCWNYMIACGDIPPFDNLLFHVDSHIDFDGEYYRFDLNSLPVSLEESKKLAYERMGIAEFIKPAVYQRIFTQVVFMLASERDEIAEHNLKALSYENGKLLEQDLDERTLEYIALHEQQGVLLNIRPYSYFVGGHAFYQIVREMPYVLDIDLDFFCCDDTLSSATEPRRVEITKEQYRKIVDNPYHFLRTDPCLFCFAYEEKGHYYLNIPGPDKSRKPEEIPKETIMLRIDKFFSYLKNNCPAPVAIDICRSRISGYLPRYAFPWVEDEVLQRLQTLYEIEIRCRPGFEYPEM